MANLPTTSERAQLDELGYVLMPNVMGPALLRDLRDRVKYLYALEGDAAGCEFKQEPGTRRLANLLNKGRVFQRVVDHPVILPLVKHVLRGSVKLSSVNARSAEPFGEQPQPLHCDMNALPDAGGDWVCNTVWMLDDFTLRNGPLRVIPGSHRWRQRPQDALPDPLTDHPDQRAITGTAGSVIVMNSHLWHGGMVNQTALSRMAVHAFFCRADKPQQQYQRQLLDKEVQQSLSPLLRGLLALDDPLNDELAKQDVTRSGFLK